MTLLYFCGLTDPYCTFLYTLVFSKHNTVNTVKTKLNQEFKKWWLPADKDGVFIKPLCFRSLFLLLLSYCYRDGAGRGVNREAVMKDIKKLFQ